MRGRPGTACALSARRRSLPEGTSRVAVGLASILLALFESANRVPGASKSCARDAYPVNDGFGFAVAVGFALGFAFTVTSAVAER